jgi:Flp pilus assembly pilin Flp
MVQKEDCGASLVEYALLLALITVAVIAGINIFGQNVSLKFSTLDSELTHS